MPEGHEVVLAPVSPPVAETPPPALAEPKSLIGAIVKLARDPEVDVAKLDALLKMQADMEERQAKRESIEAFAALSADMPRVKKSGVIELGKGRAIPFAKWEDMDKIIRPLLARHGFTLSFDSAPRQGEGGGLVVTGELQHVRGHVRRASIPLPLDSGPGRNNLQAQGSTLSYGKRYCAEMLLNIVREGDDDDGNKGGTAFLAPEQIEEIQKLIEETKTDIARYCGAMKVASLAEIPQAAFPIAKNLLLQKRQKGAA